MTGLITIVTRGQVADVESEREGWNQIMVGVSVKVNMNIMEVLNKLHFGKNDAKSSISLKISVL